MDFTTLIMYILASLIVIFFVLPVHEFAHGFTAVQLGDKTPKYQGRLTLNPLAHIDYFGALAILLFGFGWAKPVQVNMRNFKNPKVGMAITAFAGPLSNIIFAFLTLCLFKGLFLLGVQSVMYHGYVNVLLSYLITINIYLAVFNLLPVPPLDGSRLLSAFLPDRIYYKIMQYEQFIIWGIFILLWVGVLDVPMNFLRYYIMTGLDFVTRLIFGI
ncbi:MAG TPA: site-2 protease family protein [Ruminococcaceae bacterium]|nr:site-2 protease family protein [Oscillospiraceae bacterium]